jgi:hypothetical protein
LPARKSVGCHRLALEAVSYRELKRGEEKRGEEKRGGEK